MVVVADKVVTIHYTLTNDEGKEAFVRRDSVVLQGRGLIGLGKLPDASAPDAIRYQLEE